MRPSPQQSTEARPLAPERSNRCSLQQPWSPRCAFSGDTARLATSKPVGVAHGRRSARPGSRGQPQECPGEKERDSERDMCLQHSCIRDGDVGESLRGWGGFSAKRVASSVFSSRAGPSFLLRMFCWRGLCFEAPDNRGQLRPRAPAILNRGRWKSQVSQLQKHAPKMGFVDETGLVGPALL